MTTSARTTTEKSPPSASPTIPRPTDFVSSPLRNRLRVALRAPAPAVWSLVGDPGRYPEYSSNMERVDVERDASGACTAFVCNFKPMEPGAPGIAHRENVRWLAPGVGYASSPDDDNVWGLKDTLTLVTLAPTDEGTLLTWDEHFEADDLAMSREVFDAALADIGENLVRTFGGRVVERFVEGNG